MNGRPVRRGSATAIEMRGVSTRPGMYATECSQSAWVRPPITMRSPGPGARSWVAPRPGRGHRDWCAAAQPRPDVRRGSRSR